MNVVRWWRRRREVRYARQQLQVLWALRQFADLRADAFATATDVARLVDLAPHAVMAHLQILTGCGCVAVDRPDLVDGRRSPSTFWIRPEGHVYADSLTEGLLAAASPWAGAGFQSPGKDTGLV